MNCITIKGELVTPKTEAMAYEQTNQRVDTLEQSIQNDFAGVRQEITETANEVESRIGNEMEVLNGRLTSDISSVDGRIDNIIAHNSDTEGNSELIDIRTGADGIAYTSAGSAVRNQFDMLQSNKADASLFAIDTEWITDITHPVCEIGSLSGSTGENTENAARIRNDTHIRLNEGDSIDFSDAYASNLATDRIGNAVLYHYNIHKEFISHESMSLGTSTRYTATNIEYIRFVCSKSSGAVTSEWAAATSGRIKIEKPQTIQTLDIDAMLEGADADAFISRVMRNKTKSWYNGKKFAFLGDSITHLDNYSFLINNFAPDSVSDCGISGTTVCGSGSDAMWQDVRINSLPLDADIIHVMGGTNDNFQNKPIGEVSLDNCDTNTFVGAYNVLLSKIYYRYFKETTGKYNQTIDYSGVTRINADRYSGYPYIIVATPFYSIQAQENESKYADAIKEIAKMWHIPCVDHYYLDGINDQNAYRYQDDDVHPNARGRIKMYGTLQGTLMSIEPPEIN